MGMRVGQGFIQGIALAGTLAATTLCATAAVPGPTERADGAMSQGTALAFPGALGWAAHTPGGRGGRIVRVTTLAATGPGSFAEAVNAAGPRIVVFEVGGVIDLGMKELRITEPFLTIAGQTAPQPGITFVKGGLTIATHDVVVRHIRMRPGDGGMPKRSGDIDAITTVRGARDVIVDHCSLTWATDENLSASSTRFFGESEKDWMDAASRRITYSNNIVAEGLANATHAKGEHSKGTLIHDHVNDVLIVGNLYAHNYERNPLFKGGARGQVINNLIYDPGQRGVHYNLIAEEWLGHPYSRGQVVARGNVMRAGISTEDVAFFSVGGSGDVDVYLDDNLAVGPPGERACAAGPLHDDAGPRRCDEACAGASARRDAAAVGAGTGRGDRQCRRAALGSRRRRPPHPGRRDRRPRPHHRQPGTGGRRTRSRRRPARRSCRPTGTWTRWSR